MLKDNRDKLDLIANSLIERETLEGAELEELLKNGKISLKKKLDGQSTDIASSDATLGTEDGPGPKIVFISRGY
jgi:cell division protease FtsH